MKITLEFGSHEELVDTIKLLVQSVLAETTNRGTTDQGTADWPDTSRPPAALRLRDWREANDVTAVQMGKMLGYAKSKTRNGCPMMSQIELGYCRPSRPKRKEIERITGVPRTLWDEGDWGRRKQRGKRYGKAITREQLSLEGEE